MTEYSPTFTLTDDLLVRYLDEEASDQERATVDDLERGSAAAVRLWELGEASERFSALLADLAIPDTPKLRTPSLHAPGWGLKAAMIALLAVAGTVAAMPSTRATIARGIGAVSGWVGGASVATPGRAPAGASVTLPVTGSGFILEIEHAQRAGSLSIERAAISGVQAEAGPAVELVVLAGRLLVRNTPDSDADITIRVPLSVRTIRLAVAGLEMEVRLSDNEPWARIPLREPVSR